MDPQLLLMREGESSLPAPVTKLSAMPLSPAHWRDGKKERRNWAAFSDWEQQRGFRGKLEVKACPRVAACWDIPSKQTSQSGLMMCTEDAGKPARAEPPSGLVGSLLLRALCRELAPGLLLLAEQVLSETLPWGLLTLLPPSLSMSFWLPNDGLRSQVSGRNMSKALPVLGAVQRGGVATSKPQVDTKAGVSQSITL